MEGKQAGLHVDSLAGKQVGRLASRLACWHGSRQVGKPVGRLASSYAALQADRQVGKPVNSGKSVGRMASR